MEKYNSIKSRFNSQIQKSNTLFEKKKEQNKLTNRFRGIIDKIANFFNKKCTKKSLPIAHYDIQENYKSDFSEELKSGVNLENEVFKHIPTIDINDINFENKKLYFHLSKKEDEESIEKGKIIDGKFYDGLLPQIGTNSKGMLGKEITPKVFFTESLKGTLMYINRTMNIIKYNVDNSNVEKIARENKEYDFAEDIYNKMKNENMESVDTENITMEIMKEYLKKRIYYKLDLNGRNISIEQYNNLPKEEQIKIDYVDYDYNEESKGAYHTINNKHTISGKGVSKEKLRKITFNGEDSALAIVEGLACKYKELYPDEEFPTVEHKNGNKDIELVGKFINKIIDREEHII